MFVLETERLGLREFASGDADTLHAVLGDPEVMRYSVTGARTRAEVEDGIRAFQEGYRRDGFGFWAVIDKTTKLPIGFCGLKPLDIDGVSEIELGYRLARAYWRRGLATEIAGATCRYAFDNLGLNRIVAAIDATNRASLRVAEKLGMRYWRPFIYQGIPLDVYLLTQSG